MLIVEYAECVEYVECAECWVLKEKIQRAVKAESTKEMENKPLVRPSNPLESAEAEAEDRTVLRQYGELDDQMNQAGEVQLGDAIKFLEQELDEAMCFSADAASPSSEQAINLSAQKVIVCSIPLCGLQCFCVPLPLCVCASATV